MKCFFGLLFIALFTGCGVGVSFTGASIPPDAKSISVQYFQNNAALAGPTMSQTFTDALRDYVTAQSHLPLVTNGDLDFAGSITGFSTQASAATSGTTGQSSLTRLTITIEVTFSDKNDPKKNFTASFSRYADFPSNQNLASVQNDLITQINQQLVQDVFDKAFNNW
ncbi:MAG: LPS assembly lipoprotein LptE [Bacteroidia bacterium]